jgi:hypothetical protein
MIRKLSAADQRDSDERVVAASCGRSSRVVGMYWTLPAVAEDVL